MDTTTLPAAAPQRRFRRLVASAVAAAALAPVPLVQLARPAGAQTTPGFAFAVQQITAIDETGPDGAGSDEVYIKTWDHTRNSYGSGHTRSSTYAGMDTGESRLVKGSETCIAATQAIVDKDGNGNLNGSKGDTWACKLGDAAPGTVDATVELYEQETFGDQRLGTKHIKMLQPQLRQLMPKPGDIHIFEETFSNGGVYKLRFVIQRVR